MTTNNTSTVFYNVLLLKTYEGYMLKLHERDDKCTEVMGFCCHRNGDTTYAERKHLIRNKGDILVAVNGQDVSGKTHRDIEEIINCAEVSVTLRLIDIVSTAEETSNEVAEVPETKPTKTIVIAEPTVTQPTKETSNKVAEPLETDN
jgi:hypothetical protein